MRGLGWRIERKRYFLRLLYIPSLVLSLLRVKRNVHLRAPGIMMKKVHRLLAWICNLEYKLFPYWWYGTSIIICCTVRESVEADKSDLPSS